MENEETKKAQDEIDPRFGDLLMYWTMSEFHQHERGTVWYAIFLLIGITLILIAIFSANYIFAVLLVLIGTFMVMEHFRDPKEVPIVFLTTGIAIGDHYHPWEEIKNFWIAYEPPEVQKLYIDFEKIRHPYVSIDIDDSIDPVELRDMLLQYTHENDDRMEESLTDYIKRLYKL